MKVLIAEDCPFSRKLLTAILEKMGHVVVSAGDGLEAWRAYSEAPAPLIISDWTMPRSDGLRLCETVRSSDRLPYTYFIMVTEHRGKQNYLKAIEAGVDDFIVKPLDCDELAARIHVAQRILGLHERVKTLEKFLPICMYCKKIRDGDNSWHDIEHHIAKRTETRFTHGICPECDESIVTSQLREHGIDPDEQEFAPPVPAVAGAVRGRPHALPTV